MKTLCLYIKTYEGSLDQFEVLIDSVYKHNIAKLPIVVSVNPGQVNIFERAVAPYRGAREADIQIIDDSSYYEPHRPVDKWRYQQLIKANFWRTKLADVYVSIDSDSIFLKDFESTNFMWGATPFTVMHESKDMLEFMVLDGQNIDKTFYREAQRVIRLMVGNANMPLWDWGPSPFIWSRDVWKSIFNDYLGALDITLEDAMGAIEHRGVNFSEYMLYGEYLWARKDQFFDIIPIQPLMKVYHWESQFIHDFERGVRASHLKQNYLGVILQSNWLNGKVDTQEFLED